jgi:putative oxidoreductase
MKKKILFVVSLLFGLMIINAGLNKFFNYMPIPDNMPEKLVKAFNAFMEIGWLLPLVGFLEIVGGILFVIPKTRALGAIVILPVMVGIMLTNTITEPSGLPIALVLFAINLWVIFENKNKYVQLLN